MCCPPAASVALTSEVAGEPALGPDEQHYQAGGGMGGGGEGRVLIAMHVYPVCVTMVTRTNN